MAHVAARVVLDFKTSVRRWAGIERELVHLSDGWRLVRRRRLAELPRWRRL